MKRILSSLSNDIRSSFRTGFAAASSLVTLVWILGLSRLPETTVSTHFVLFLASLLFLQFFVGVLQQIRREQIEGTFALLRATPLRPQEYLAAKAGSCMVLGLIQAMLFYTLILGFPVGFLFLTFGVVVLISLATLAGFMIAVQYPKPRFRILPVGVIVLVVALSWMPALGFPLGAWKYVHPLQPSLTLMEMAVHGGSTGSFIYGLGYGCFGVALALVFCKRALERH